jgi:hypothetical protein
MPIELVDAEEVTGRRGRTKGEKYGKYVEAIHKHIEWIKEKIKDSKDGTIRMKVNDIAKEMGPDFVGKDERSTYNGLKYVLFNEGIFVELGTHKDGDKLLIMRFAINSDRLPQHLAKYLESEGEESGEEE